jgi:hypothetical protein
MVARHFWEEAGVRKIALVGAEHGGYLDPWLTRRHRQYFPRDTLFGVGDGEFDGVLSSSRIPLNQLPSHQSDKLPPTITAPPINPLPSP